MTRLAIHWQILIAMLLAVLAGVAVKLLFGTRRLPEPIAVPAQSLQVLGMDRPARVSAGKFWSQDEPQRVLIQWEPAPAKESRREPLLRAVVGLLPPETDLTRMPWPKADPARGEPEYLHLRTLDELQKRRPDLFALFVRHGRSGARRWADRLRLLGLLFLRMLRMVSVPLVLFSLIAGVMSLGETARLGRMFLRTFLYYLMTSALAVGVGLLWANLIAPGKQAQIAIGDPAGHEHFLLQAGKSLDVILWEQVETLIPTNPFAALAQAEFLSIISFSLMVGVFALVAGGEVAQTVRRGAQAGFTVMMRMTLAILYLAPVGVFGLLFHVTVTQGLTVFGGLGVYMLTVFLALCTHAVVVLPLVLWLLARRNPWQYARALSPALLMAFSSSSSNATLPVTMASAEERAGVPNRICSFVLPLGATVNMDGTALYEVIAVLFIANLSGIELTLFQQVVVAYTALLVSIGAAGIPHAGLVMMVVILQAVGLPLEAQGLIIAVDRVLDMSRTVVNIWSDSIGCAVIARFDQPESAPAAGG